MKEHWGLVKWGRREVLVITFLGVATALAIGYFASPWWSIIPAVVTLWGVLFFRDPVRAIPEGESNIVAPADGKIVEITEVDEPDFIGGKALKIGIFLSIFDVHINRAPCSGSVEMISYRPGKFLNALKQESSRVNENNSIGITGSGCRMLVKQIAGAIARRIVCACEEGDLCARGEKLGMIKFGSRTELYVPAGADFHLSVKLGEKVRAGSSVLGTLK